MKRFLIKTRDDEAGSQTQPYGTKASLGKDGHPMATKKTPPNKLILESSKNSRSMVGRTWMEVVGGFVESDDGGYTVDVAVGFVKEDEPEENGGQSDGKIGLQH